MFAHSYKFSWAKVGGLSRELGGGRTIANGCLDTVDARSAGTGHRFHKTLAILE